jgi:hypothetical protein
MASTAVSISLSRTIFNEYTYLHSVLGEGGLGTSDYDDFGGDMIGSGGAMGQC